MAQTKIFFPLQRAFFDGAYRPKDSIGYAFKEGWDTSDEEVFAPFDGRLFSLSHHTVSEDEISTWTASQLKTWKAVYGTHWDQVDLVGLVNDEGWLAFSLGNFVANDELINTKKFKAGQVIGKTTPWAIFGFALSASQKGDWVALSIDDPRIQWAFEHEKGLLEEAHSTIEEAQSTLEAAKQGIKTTEAAVQKTTEEISKTASRGILLLGLGGLAIYLLATKKKKR